MESRNERRTRINNNRNLGQAYWNRERRHDGTMEDERDTLLHIPTGGGYRILRREIED